MIRRHALTLACAASLAALASSSDAIANAWPTEPTLPLAVTTIGPQGREPVTVSDGSGGVYVIWSQTVAGDFDLFAQHYLADGTRAPGWTASGIPVCSVSGSQRAPVAVSDGSGGFVVAWEDLRAPLQGLDVYLQRITSGGLVAPGWTPGGVKLSSSNRDEKDLAIVPDGSGGAIVAWELVFTPDTDFDIYAGRVKSAGSVDFLTVVHGPTGLQLDVSAIPDGNGGAFLAWRDDLNTRIAAQHLSPSGSLLWTSSHVTVRSFAGGLWDPLLAPDATGGFYVAWSEGAAPPSSLGYLARFDGAGNPVWPGPVATSPSMLLTGSSVADAHVFHELAADGLGGVYAAYMVGAFSGARPTKVTRILPGGTRATGWPDGGIEVFSNTLLTFPFGPGVHLSEVQPDGSGGAYVAVAQQNSASADIQARVVRVVSNGAFAPGWGYDGMTVGSSSIAPGEPTLVALPGGNVFMAWESVTGGDPRSEILANRIDHFGYLGDPSPAIVSVRDVANDQGGRVRVSWTRSYLDSDPNYAVGSYRLWRQLPAGQSSLRSARNARFASSFDQRQLDRGAIVATTSGAATIYWELAGTQVAQALPAYSMTLDTAGDSTTSGNPRTQFMVTALHQYLNQFWNSNPDSGYSVDNLAPPTPAPFTGTYGSGSASLHWTPSPAPDFLAFRLFRGAIPDFEPSAGTFVVETTDTGYVDVTPLPRYYKLVAVDVHGNVSAAARVGPGSIVDVGPAPSPALAFAPPSPNPARGPCEFSFTLPAAAAVRLAVHDARGRLVRVVLQGERAAGANRVAWNGDDAAGRDAGSGLFFARLETGGRTLTRKLVRTR